MTMLLEFLERHRARHLFRSSHVKRGRILKIGSILNEHIFLGLIIKRLGK